MTRSDPATAFWSLGTPPEGDHFMFATPFPGHENHRIAKTEDGYPSVLIRIKNEANSRPSLPVVLRYIQVNYSTEYRIRRKSGEIEEGDFASIICKSYEHAFVRYFFATMSGLLDAIGDVPSSEVVTGLIRTLLQLFRAMALPASRTVQGVWAELFIVATSRIRLEVARAWHSSPVDRYDFSMGTQRVEVKSSSSRERRHRFSFAQLDPPVGAHLWIASLFVERAAGGLTLSNLIDRASAGLPSDEHSRLRLLVAETLGEDFEIALDRAFDAELAAESLRYYKSADIPSLAPPLPFGVSDVNFVADLSTASPIVPHEIQSSALLRALPEQGFAVG